MSCALTYDLRGWTLSGIVNGRFVSVPVHPTSSAITKWDHQFELRPGAFGGGMGFTIAENAALEVFDYPGRYAQRFDGAARGGSSGPPLPPPPSGPVPLPYPSLTQAGPAAALHTGRGTILIHGWPPRGEGPSIVVLNDLGPLLAALAAETRASLVLVR